MLHVHSKFAQKTVCPKRREETASKKRCGPSGDVERAPDMAARDGKISGV